MSKSGKSTGTADSNTNTLRREGTHTPRNARRRPHNSRAADLRQQIATCESLIRTFTVMRNQADAELAALAEDAMSARTHD